MFSCEHLAEIILLVHEAVDADSVAFTLVYLADCLDLFLEDKRVAF